MPAVSELEKQRLANIERNRALLKSLNLTREATEEAMNELSPSGSKPAPKKTTITTPKPRPRKRESDVSLRRSKRVKDNGSAKYNEIMIACEVFGDTESRRYKKLQNAFKNTQHEGDDSSSLVKTSKQKSPATRLQKNGAAQNSATKNASQKKKQPGSIAPKSANGANKPEVLDTQDSFSSAVEVPKTPPKVNSKEASTLKETTVLYEEIASSQESKVSALSEVQEAQDDSLPYPDHVQYRLSSPLDAQHMSTQDYDYTRTTPETEDTTSIQVDKLATSTPMTFSEDAHENLHLLKRAVTSNSLASISSTPLAEVQLRTHAHKKDKPVDLECIQIHPSVIRKLVCVGDSRGQISIWNSDHDALYGQESDQSVVNRFKMHSKKRVSSMYIHPSLETKLYSSGWDAKISCLDLETGEPQRALLDLADLSSSDDSVRDVVTRLDGGNNPDLLYFSTNTGYFGHRDTRLPENELLYLKLCQSSIINFSLNPAKNEQFATIDLDRKMKVWDMRYLSNSPDYTTNTPSSVTAPHLYGYFQDGLNDESDTNSLLTSVSWNSNGTLLTSTVDASDPDCHIIDSVQLFTHPIQAASTWSNTITFDRPFKYTSTVILDRSTYFLATPQASVALGPTDFAEYNHYFKHRISTSWQLQPRDSVQKFAVVSPKRTSVVIYNEQGQTLNTLQSSDTKNTFTMVQMHPSLNWLASVTSDNRAQTWS